MRKRMALGLAVVLGMLIVLGSTIWFLGFRTYHVVGTVESKYVTSETAKNENVTLEYRVILDNGETLSISGNLIVGGALPSETYSRLQIGVTYDFVCWSIPPKIISFTLSS